MNRSFVALALTTAALPAALGAQRIEGQLRTAQGTPAGGAVLTALAADGAAIGRSVTRDDGSFVLYLDREGAARVVAKRVGLLADTLDAPAVAGEAVATLEATLSDRRLLLGGGRPSGATCDRTERGRASAMTVWQEILAAATAARYRIGRSDTQGRWVSTQFRVAKQTDDTLRAALRRGSGSLPNPFPVVTPERLEDVGFFATVGGDRTFYVPDLEIIATDWFLETHCVRLRRLDGDSLLVSFEPTRIRRGRVDVAGELTLDHPSLAVRSMRFRYVDLPATERESGAGGSIRFARTNTGGWLVSEWWQRTPFLNYFAGEGNTTFIRTQMTLVDVVAHFVSGGRVLAVADDGGLRYQRDPFGVRIAGTPFARYCTERTSALPTAAVHGVLLADSTDIPLPGTVIRASWTVPVIVNRTELTDREEVREATTAEDGSWAICDIPVDRDLVIRWETGSEERRIPVRVTQPLSLTQVMPPRG
ncbi:MAG: carboxypeptidase regulatory-like domain-containing protein [Gemmatimonadaceae bacterium]|nr:carboxypeptidase regulatory-like domain-containing protein [Gemmatimonadaceae bacterium]MCW5825103.1 carboxypeptidase regulatory-like domain-containing protein [Gemmatimonadaceae bacterium]